MTNPTTTVAAALRRNGTEVIFGLPGGGPNLDLIGAAAECGIRFVLAHAETSAAVMASTFGLLTGTPSAVVVTRGPGATSVVNGVAQATLDRYPLVVITDTVSAADATRVPHQRIAQRELMAPVTKATSTISATSSEGHVLELIALANATPRGAVHLDIDATAASEAGEQLGPVVGPATSSVAKVIGDEAAARRLIQAAARPVIILGINAVDAAPALRPILDRLGAPVLTTYQAIGCVSTEGPLHGGLFTNGAAESHLLAEADLIVIIGLDMVEPIPNPWTHAAPVLSLTPVPTKDRYLPIEIELIGDPGALAARLLDGVSPSWPRGSGARFRETSRAALRPPTVDGVAGDVFGPVDLVETVSRLAPPEATITVDAGAHFLAVMPFWPVEHPLQLLISNGLATMGFSLPAAIGAALARPKQPVICFTGDGGLAMTLGELETIARLHLPVTVIVFNDSALTLIELKQSPSRGGRDVVRFGPVDFGAQARAAGLAGSIVRDGSELEEALVAGWDHPRLVDARIDPSAYRHLITVTRG